MKQIQPWHWRNLPLNQRSGSEIFQTLFLGKTADSTSSISACFPGDMAVLLESPVTSSTNLARYSICAGSPRIIDGQSQLWTPPVGEILPFLRALLDSQKQTKFSSECTAGNSFYWGLAGMARLRFSMGN